MTLPITLAQPSGTRPVGIEIFYFMDRWMDDQAAYFAKAKDCGFDGVEISLMPHLLDDHQRLLAEATSSIWQFSAAQDSVPRRTFLIPIPQFVVTASSF